MTPRFRIVLTPLADADGGGWFAEIPDLPGCCSDGETPEEAAKNIQDAQKLWMKIQGERGKTVPEPKGYEI
jgi:predicted RNase H-like HicB family nuclease